VGEGVPLDTFREIRCGIKGKTGSVLRKRGCMYVLLQEKEEDEERKEVGIIRFALSAANPHHPRSFIPFPTKNQV